MVLSQAYDICPSSSHEYRNISTFLPTFSGHFSSVDLFTLLHGLLKCTVHIIAQKVCCFLHTTTNQQARPLEVEFNKAPGNKSPTHIDHTQQNFGKGAYVTFTSAMSAEGLQEIR